MSAEERELLPGKKIRFRSTANIHYANENKVEDLRNTELRKKWDDNRETRKNEEVKKEKG
jgi:hypothetical protein